GVEGHHFTLGADVQYPDVGPRCSEADLNQLAAEETLLDHHAPHRVPGVYPVPGLAAVDDEFPVPALEPLALAIRADRPASQQRAVPPVEVVVLPAVLGPAPCVILRPEDVALTGQPARGIEEESPPWHRPLLVEIPLVRPDCVGRVVFRRHFVDVRRVTVFRF